MQHLIYMVHFPASGLTIIAAFGDDTANLSSHADPKLTFLHLEWHLSEDVDDEAKWAELCSNNFHFAKKVSLQKNQ